MKGPNAWFRAVGIETEVPLPALRLDNQALLYPAVMEPRGVAIGMRSLVAEYLDRRLMVEPLATEWEFGPPLAIVLIPDGNMRLAKKFGAWLRELLSVDVGAIT